MTVDERNGDRESEELYGRVAEIIETARKQVARTVNTAMVHAYWNIGREIVEVEQRGRERADYGDELMPGLSRRLAAIWTWLQLFVGEADEAVLLDVPSWFRAPAARTAWKRLHTVEPF